MGSTSESHAMSRGTIVKSKDLHIPDNIEATSYLYSTMLKIKGKPIEKTWKWETSLKRDFGAPITDDEIF